jgi:hypothetical protein
MGTTPPDFWQPHKRLFVRFVINHLFLLMIFAWKLPTPHDYRASTKFPKRLRTILEMAY